MAAVCSFSDFSRRSFTRIKSPWSPQSRNSSITSSLMVFGAGLLGQPIRLVPFHYRWRNLHHEFLAEQVGYVPEGIDRICRGFVFQCVIDQEFVGCFPDRFPLLFAALPLR